MTAIATLRRLLRRYRLQVVLRAVGVAAAAGGAVAAVLLGGGTWALPALGLGLLAMGLTGGLVRYVERTPKDLLRFLEGLRYDDLTLSVSAQGRGPLFEAIAAGFAEMTGAFRRLRTEREEQAQYLQTVVRHVGIALIAFRDDGGVSLFNPAAKRLLGVPRLREVGALARRSPRLAEALPRLKTGERSLVRVEATAAGGDRPLDLAVHATRFRLHGEPHTLVSLQDIRQELEEREMEAWQQLTRVLTHEIVNSVAPIASLAATARDLLPASGPASGDGGGGITEALATIERRSQGLIHFVESYRSLTRVPAPQFELFPAAELFGSVRTLLGHSFREHGIALEIAVEPEGLELAADPELVEQVLINLLLNAIEALEEQEDARVRLAARVGETGRPVIEVTDNGPGIEPEVRDRVFVPFFTTKATGSGIGLSLSRQILRLHGGALTVRSEPGTETTFALRF